jgi:hypothetical protein
MANIYASGSTHPYVSVVDSTTSTVITTLIPAFTALAVAVSPDGNWLAFASGLPQVQFAPTAAPHSYGPAITTGLTGVAALVWAHDSSLVYCVGPFGVQTCTPGGALGTVGVVSDASGSVTQAALSPDGSHLYVGAATKVYELTTSLYAFTNTYSGLAGVKGMAISPDGHTLYVSDYRSPAGTIYAINTATGAMTTEGANNNPGCLLVSPDGSRLWCAENGSGLVQVFDAGSLAVLQTITAPSAYAIAFSTDGSQVWVGSSDGTAIPVLFPIDTTTYTAGPGVTDFGGYFLQVVAVAATVPPPGPSTPSGHATVTAGPLVVTATSTATATGITGTAVLNIGPLVVRAADVIATRLGTALVALGPLIIAGVGARPGPGGFPIPGYRGRWRLTLHTRTFAPATLNSTLIAELADARGRQLVQAWGTPAVLTFSMDGHAQAAALIEELEHDVVAWRFDDRTGLEVAVFRGPITASQDQLTTESHTVTYTCQDYAAVLSRRLLTTTYTVTARDQDLIAGDLLAAGSTASSSSGTSFSPASYVPVTLATVNPDGTTRGLSTRTRDRTYYGSQNVYDALDNLAKIIDGFDWDVQPSAVNTTDSLRIFYPAQGVTRTDIALQYGSTVATVTRSLSSADYANYVRVLGNNTSANPTPQFFAEDWNTQATATTPIPVGLWMTDDTSQTSVTVQSTLDEKASGDLALDANLTPQYTLGLTPGWYTWGNPNMGDTVPLIVQSGRLDDYYTPGVRVLGITYQIGDDGQEDVTLTVSRPAQTLGGLLADSDRDLKALTRR